MGKRGPQTSRRIYGQRPREEVEAMAPALSARSRIHSIDIKNAQDQRAGSVIGRLCMTGQLLPEHYQAALMYQQVAEANSKAVGAPKGDGAMQIGRVGGKSVDSASQDARDIRAQRAYASAREAIRQAAQKHRIGMLFAVADLIVIRDHDLTCMYHLLPVLLDALAEHFGLSTRKVKPSIDHMAGSR